MIYATQADLIAQFGESEMISLTDRVMVGVVDAAVVAHALQRASATMDGYLARFSIQAGAVPSQLVDICCDIARYKLSGAEVTETDPTRVRFKDALKTLEQIRDGKIDIGLTQAGQAVAETATVRVVGGGRVFNSSSLDDY